MSQSSRPSPDHALPFIASPSPGLRALTAHYKATLATDAFDKVAADIKSYFDDFTASLMNEPAGVARADRLHELMDLTLKASANMEKSCKRGCGGCCHYEVEITKDEGDLLAAAVRHGQKIDFARLNTQAARERKSTEWLKFWSPNNRCVFLGDDSTCQIYDYRPSICRKHSVVSPASACTTTDAPVVPVEVPLAEILLSAALSIANTPKSSLSKILLACLEDAAV